MPERKLTRFFKNLAYAFSAQGIALILSAIQILIMPKFLGVREFSYFQLFIFYSTYVGIFHFGLIDGIYLRTGGKHYHELDFRLIGSQFWYTIVGQVLIALGIIAYGALTPHNSESRFVLYTTAINLIITNAITYVGYIFQATNHTRKFSISVMISKIFFLVFIAALIIFKQKHFQAFTVLYLVAQFASLVFCIYTGRQFVFAKLLEPFETLREMGINISVGINLMLSNFASMLILGSARIAIKQRWDIEAFGKISLAVSLTNFFLLFISQVSMVLFPALRQTDSESIKKYYRIMRNGLGVLLPVIPLFYLPISFILGLWLPKYKVSLEYLALLLPLCIFDGKMQMLCNTYLKVLRKERVILFINFLSVVLSIILSAIGALVIQNISAIVIFMSTAVAFRSVIAELYLSRLMNINAAKNLIGEILIASLFIVLSLCTGKIEAFLIYLAAYAVYIFIWRKSAKSTFLSFKGILKH
ncbi:hypothetical protein CCDG5_1842 [[Clostridium] cellulosi]|uniref:Polysaccharide biosynthesis protein n=1 Tax=[Clostridium] cellulosi TaxID=29343 RepID=A0A078KUU1_9FIRM|nr:hypothetical protein CCDG5_1842 [[Clostridium] cellulosi]